jgi:hypothetical protein
VRHPAPEECAASPRAGGESGVVAAIDSGAGAAEPRTPAPEECAALPRASGGPGVVAAIDDRRRRG